MTGDARVALIRTRPLAEGNYGGVLQAYALQRALANLGVSAVTDTSRGTPARERAWRLPAVVKDVVATTVARVAPGPLAPASWVARTVKPERDSAITAFVDTHINTAQLYLHGRRVDRELLSRVDLFVTGSDQVWRERYGRVPTYLFDFLAEDDTRPRIAYAASFGTAGDDYPESLIRATAPLARRLTAVSVRESAGVAAARDLWNVDAEHVLDPTLLLDQDHYAELASTAPTAADPGQLVSYVLDAGAASAAVTDAVASAMSSPATHLHQPPPRTFAAYARHRDRYRRPSVESWLRAIASAGMLVTDSYHGTVFAILFNTPFVALVNRRRGAARFESLLETFGLEDRLVAAEQAASVDLAPPRIDWSRVNATLAHERQRSLAFLRQAVEVR